MIRVKLCTSEEIAPWLALRMRLWPEGDESSHCNDIVRMLQHPEQYVAFCATDANDAIGFAEASLRSDYVNGCETSPVAFLEGMYVEPSHRRRGVARALSSAVEEWARARDCIEFASDALLHNEVSHKMHAALGFTETERVVYFRKLLRS